MQSLYMEFIALNLGCASLLVNTGARAGQDFALISAQRSHKVCQNAWYEN